MRKKVLFLAIAAAVIFTACGQKAENKGTDADVAVIEEVKDEEPAKEPEDEESEKESEAEEPVKEPEASPDASSDTIAGESEENEGEKEDEVEGDESGDKEADDEYEKGIVTQTGWESEYLGMRYTAPEGMGMATEEALNDMMGIGQEVLSQDFSELQLKYAQMKTCYEMMSSNATGTVNVILMVEKLPLMGMDAEGYLAAVKQSLSLVSSISYEVLSDNEEVEIAGAEFMKLSCAADYQGNSMHQDYYARVIGNRAVAIAVTYTGDAAQLTEDIMNAFEAY